MQTVPTSACAVSFIPSRLASWTLPAPEFAGAIDRSRDISIDRDKALLVDGVVNEGKIQA